jgi:hypothetical protein
VLLANALAARASSVRRVNAICCLRLFSEGGVFAL